MQLLSGNSKLLAKLIKPYYEWRLMHFAGNASKLKKLVSEKAILVNMLNNS